MYSVILAIVILKLASATSEESSNLHNEVANHNRNNHGASVRPTQNMTFIDKDENMLRMPALNKYFEEHKSKKKTKKSPKRTIQKIIKKNKGKLRKVYFSQATKRSTIPPKVNYEKNYGQDESKKWKGETTTRDRNFNHNHKHKNTKVTRYHMPFQKLQKKKEDRRHKRGLSRELFILKDLDQIQFLSKENDNDVVNAHITNYLKV